MIDEIADRVANKLITKSMMSNIQVNDTNMVPTSALVNSMANNIAQLNDEIDVFGYATKVGGNIDRTDGDFYSLSVHSENNYDAVAYIYHKTQNIFGIDKLENGVWSRATTFDNALGRLNFVRLTSSLISQNIPAETETKILFHNVLDNFNANGVFANTDNSCITVSRAGMYLLFAHVNYQHSTSMSNWVRVMWKYADDDQLIRCIDHDYYLSVFCKSPMDFCWLDANRPIKLVIVQTKATPINNAELGLLYLGSW